MITTTGSHKNGVKKRQEEKNATDIHETEKELLQVVSNKRKYFNKMQQSVKWTQTVSQMKIV